VKSKQQELAKLEQDYQEERAGIEQKFIVLDSLKERLGNALEEYHPPFIYRGRLYGSEGVISFKGTDCDSLRDGRQPDKALLAALIAAYPPAPVGIVMDGSTAFMPYISVPVDKLDQAVIIAPVTVFVEPRPSKAIYKWFAYIGDALWRFEFGISLYKTRLGNLRINYYKGSINAYDPVIESCHFDAAYGSEVIRWATGDFSNRTPNNFTLYWHLANEPEDITGSIREDV
jgi:hypothetical protein